PIAGMVTRAVWMISHFLIFMNVVVEPGEVENWAVELESAALLEKRGWRREALRPGDAIAVEGLAARDGTRQIWAQSLVLSATGRDGLDVRDTAPIAPIAPRPTPRWPDGTPMLGSPDTRDGYWGYPTETALVEDGVAVAMRPDGLLEDIGDAAKVAPLQPWALGLYVHRQSRGLQDDPIFLNCKPPGGVRHFQSPLGVQLIEDRDAQRVFVLMGSGNRNYRIIYLDGRAQVGQVGGDDDNPLYYGRSVGKWEGDTLVVDTIGFNEDFWFTEGGLPHTDLLQLTERVSRPDFDTLRYEVTIDERGAYTRP